MYPDLLIEIENLHFTHLQEERKILLQPLIDFIQQKTKEKQDINIIFICTHNSRRSHFAQIWAQTAAYYYGKKMFFAILEELRKRLFSLR